MIRDDAVMIASGCGGTGRELHAMGGLAGVDAFVTRTLTLDPRTGGPPPRIAESPAGLVNSIGVQNPGLELFLARELPWLAAAKVRTHVSISGTSLGEYVDLARRLGSAPGVHAIELNLSLPESREWGFLDTREPFQAARVVTAVRDDLPRGIEVHAKLGPDPARVVESARAVSEAGADAVVLVNAAPALMPDGRPGGLSGPALRPLALRCVHEVHRALPDQRIIGVGGIATTDDARSFLTAGARAVQLGTGVLHDPISAARIAAELRGETP